MTRAFICGCAGLGLSDDERAFIAESDPWGLILFKRNVGDRAQLRALTDAFRAIVGRADAPVLIDQEGGRVQRLAPPHWPSYPAAATFDQVADRDEAEANVRLAARLIARDLFDVGVTVDCAPVLDVAQPHTHAVVGNRSYGSDPARIATLGRAFADGLMDGGVAPVMKHAPGHGRARVDSHLELPTVDAAPEDLARIDFAPFQALADLPMAMTAHVVYAHLDADHPATISPTIVRSIIRGAIGFDGLLLTDDLSMKALGGAFRDRAEAAFAAGVDIALHCNGVMEEARPVAEASPRLEGKALDRARAALARITAPLDFDAAEARARLDRAMARTAAA